jgi:hypothetical protein
MKQLVFLLFPGAKIIGEPKKGYPWCLLLGITFLFYDKNLILRENAIYV